ncbi:hypothetical protein ABT362_29665 [Nonomuraea rubra]|uniref:hypothetical protein n=1 Tax=Nonomuraea rubra TaxID=46180 RepID=UPI0033249EB7
MLHAAGDRAGRDRFVKETTAARRVWSFLNPDNVLRGPDGPRVIDFGIAHTVHLDLSGRGMRISRRPAARTRRALRSVRGEHDAVRLARQVEIINRVPEAAP